MGEPTLSLVYAVPERRTHRRPSRTGVIMGLAAAVISFASLRLGFEAAHDEPFMSGLDKRTALFYIGLGSVLATGWLAWTVVAVFFVAKRRLHWSWLLMFLWGGFNVVWINEAIDTYVGDVISYEAGLADLLPKD